ncbi:MAG: N-6 DNA methylase [Chitinispirillaceae bacterium]|nr:N-6 DNA methylase [Chitinispirillaceae bacterium]
MNTQEIVDRLWRLCDVLRDDGITYHQYVTELTYLLFLKMAKETDTEKQLPRGYRWDDLTGKDGVMLTKFYKTLLTRLGEKGKGRVREIYTKAGTNIDHPANLKKIITTINDLDWYSAKHEGLGDLYEGLLEKNAGEKKSGAGQYFTPRALINVMVKLVQPQAGERCGDPAAGTFGFMIAADRFIKAQTDELFTLTTEQREFQRKEAFTGFELVQEAHRLALMNAMLHDVHGKIVLGDTLSNSGKSFRDYDVILTNPPFGTKKGGERPTRDDLTYPTSNKQLNFLQLIYRALKKNEKARAAVVLPDNVLFAGGDGQKIRTDLMNKCNLHTILRLPTGIFYAQGVKTNVLFFTAGRSETGSTKKVWVYDLRTNMPNLGKTNPLTEKHFDEFVKCYGTDPLGGARRKDLGEDGRFRAFTREQIAARDDSLDITWLKDDANNRHDSTAEPEDLVRLAIGELEGALDDLKAILVELGAEVPS